MINLLKYRLLKQLTDNLNSNMKTINKKIKTNKYFLGGFTVPNFNGKQGADLVGSGLDAVSSLIPSSGNGKTDVITNGIASGLTTVGSAFGPLGSVIGQAAGMLTKGVGAIVGTSDQVNTDTGEYIKGKGVKGRRSRDKKIAQWNRVNQGISDAAATANLQQEYADEYGQNDYSLAAYGGVIPNTLAYLDDGELLRTPDGEISYIPEQGKPTDSNLLNVPVGTQVLSDKLKVPGTNKTFAEVGKKLMKTGKKKGNDIYAQNSQMLNERKNQQKYDELIQLQEQVKDKKNIKGRINKYNTGTEKSGVEDTDSLFRIGNKYYNLGDTINYKNRLYEVIGRNKALPINEIYSNPRRFFNSLKNNALENNKPQFYAERNLPLFNDGLAISLGLVRPGWSHGDNNYQLDYIPQIPDYDISAYFPARISNISSTNGITTQTNTSNNVSPVVQPKQLPFIQRERTSLAVEGPKSGELKIPENRKLVKPTTNNQANLELPNFASLIGPLANVYDSTPEQAPVRTYTPHFAPTEYNINPLLRDIDRNAAINRYNVNRAGGAGTGANLAQAVQSQVASDRAVAEVYAQKDNIERQRQAVNAGIYNDWARYNAEAFHRGDVENAQNRAAARHLRRTGFGQLGTALQSMSRDKRLTNRDRAVLEFMKPYLEYGTPSEALSGLYNRYYN